jgi:hypothetical protein
VLDTGPALLLSMAMKDAARYFGVSENVIPRKRIPLRDSARADAEVEVSQQKLAYA